MAQDERDRLTWPICENCGRPARYVLNAWLYPAINHVRPGRVVVCGVRCADLLNARVREDAEARLVYGHGQTHRQLQVPRGEEHPY